MIKIKIVIPNSGMNTETLRNRETMLAAAVSSDVQLSVSCIPSGPNVIESCTDEVFAAPMLIDMAKDAEKQGYNAFVVYCFSDLAVNAIRENVRIPIVGPGEIALSAACMLSTRFVVITTIDKNISRTYRRIVQKPDVREKLASVMALNIPVAELRENPDVTIEYLDKVCYGAIKDFRVDAVVLGCLGMAKYGDVIEHKYGVKVIDPAFLSVGWAEMCARLNLTHSDVINANIR